MYKAPKEEYEAAMKSQFWALFMLMLMVLDLVIDLDLVKGLSQMQINIYSVQIQKHTNFCTSVLFMRTARANAQKRQPKTQNSKYLQA